jgi:Dihydrofolate reductase
MTIHEYLMKAIQDDARRAGERDRLLREARRARRARRQRLVPAAPARRRTEMGKIVVSENVTLDGVIQDPAGDEGFRPGGWVGLIGNSPQLAKLALDEALAAGAFLLGRRSYEWLAARWPSRSGELADRLNSLPKYVVSATLANPAWNNSTVLKGDVLNEVSTLKQHIDGDIVIAGSFQLVRTLIEHDLVDELRLKIFPVALGAASACSARPATRNPCASSTPRPSRAASPTSPTKLSGTPSGVRRR